MSERRPGPPVSPQLSLFGPEPPAAADAGADPADIDLPARTFAVDPRHNVVLEASAGTGKTSVLVRRYVNLLKAGIDPANILAITFTRKAAAEMRERIVAELKASASRAEFDRGRWREIRDRLGEISISTIDAFSLSLLREFPLEADLDPAFDMADETEVPRLVDMSLDQSLRIFANLAKADPDIALVLAQLGVSRTRAGLAALLERRLVAEDAIRRFLTRGPRDLTAEIVCRRAATALQDTLRTVPGGLARFLEDGPAGHPRFQMFARDLDRLPDLERAGDAPSIRAVLDRLAAHFLTVQGTARRSGAIPPYKASRDYPSADAGRRHRDAVFQVAPQVERVLAAFARDLNAVLSRGVERMFRIALTQYRRALEERSALDFSDVLLRALDLLRRMDEFSQSRFRLESRYHHVLVDEFQDTSRAQWELVSLLIQAWGEGLGLPTHPSIFIVGDRKQSIYRFRDAEVSVLQEAGRYIERLRPSGDPRRAISRSFRSLPELLEFVNELFSAMPAGTGRPDDFTYAGTDRFPVTGARDTGRGPVLGIAAAESVDDCAAAVGAEIERVLREETVRDRHTGVPRAARPGDVAILFRSRASHREFERALEQRRIPSYVYKGLGFFDADEIKDASALLRYLADPASDLRAAALLRSRIVRLSDPGLARLGSRLAAALTAEALPDAARALGEEDRRVLLFVRGRVRNWLAMVDRVPPADLLEAVLRSTAYAYELRGPRRAQAWENLKKLRGLVRRIQNRGYATLPRIADHLDSLTAGDESNAAIEALDAVNLMTVHASKGLEFPVVFVVNLAKGASAPPRPIRVSLDADGGEPSVSVGPFVSAMDEAERERERHETRRLLYVAVTRARDRLYLSSVVKKGIMQPGRGSLGEVLPDSLRQLCNEAAAASEATVGWTAPSGRGFEWRRCAVPPPEPPGLRLPDLAEAAADPSLDRLGPIPGLAAVTRMGVTAWLQAEGAETGDDADERGDWRRDGADPVMVGTLVHRLFQFGERFPHRERLPHGERHPHEVPGVVERAAALLTPDERAAVADATLERAAALLTMDERAALADGPATIQRAVEAWRHLRAREDVHRLLAAGQKLYEVPFSLVPAGSAGTEYPGLILRGTIDCLVLCDHPSGAGEVVVLEFKTGRPRPMHQRQLDVYVEAARMMFPGRRVRGEKIYVK